MDADEFSWLPNTVEDFSTSMSSFLDPLADINQIIPSFSGYDDNDSNAPIQTGITIADLSRNDTALPNPLTRSRSSSILNQQRRNSFIDFGTAITRLNSIDPWTNVWGIGDDEVENDK